MAVTFTNTGISWGPGYSWFGTTSDTGGDTTSNFGELLYTQDVVGLFTSWQRDVAEINPSQASVSCTVRMRCGVWSETSSQIVLRLQGRFDTSGYNNYTPFALGVRSHDSSNTYSATCTGYILDNTNVWISDSQKWKYSTPLYQVTIDKPESPLSITPYMLIGYMPMYTGYTDGGGNSGTQDPNFTAGNDWGWWGNTGSTYGALVISGVARSASLGSNTTWHNGYKRNAIATFMGASYYSANYNNAPLRVVSGSTHAASSPITVYKSDGKKANPTNKLYFYDSNKARHQAASITYYDSSKKGHSVTLV